MEKKSFFYIVRKLKSLLMTENLKFKHKNRKGTKEKISFK